MRLLIFIFALSVLLVVNGCAPQETEPSLCKIDSDCVKVQSTCCPCSMGGIEKCVLATNAHNYPPKECKEKTTCIALYACEIESCVCKKGVCEEM